MRRLRKTDALENIEQAELRESIQSASRDAGVVAAMLKDIHLIEAALAADKIVLSLDERVRGFFSDASRTIEELRQIHWANPEDQRERVLHWLQNGAKPEKSRLLGYPKR
jgi:hypothetical protein